MYTVVCVQVPNTVQNLFKYLSVVRDDTIVSEKVLEIYRDVCYCHYVVFWVMYVLTHPLIIALFVSV